MGHARYLRKVVHPQAYDNYRVILTDGGLEFEIGSIGIQQGSAGTEHWTWGIDRVVPMRDVDAQDREDCMQQFRAAWDKFSADPARLAQFLETKRKRLSRCAALFA